MKIHFPDLPKWDYLDESMRRLIARSRAVRGQWTFIGYQSKYRGKVILRWMWP